MSLSFRVNEEVLIEIFLNVFRFFSFFFKHYFVGEFLITKYFMKGLKN